MLAQNLAQVRENVQAACRRVGRDPREVLLLAVTKTHPVPVLREAMELGLTDMGENRVQEWQDKYQEIGDAVHWHLIGHLQSNKAKYVVGKVQLIHSVENQKLAEEISSRAVAQGLVQDVLVELNMAGEASKFGIRPEDCESFLTQISRLPGIKVKGLMTVAPFVEDPEENRTYFRKLQELLVDMNQKRLDNITMDALSMGMSNDYTVAVEEGATIIRVGTALFGQRSYMAQTD